MSYEVYKMIHVVSIVIFFALFAAAAYSQKNEKREKILTGVFLLLILVSGMGLLARIGIQHGVAWPNWVRAKLTIWLVVGVLGHMMMKRFPQHAVKSFWGSVGLLTLASYFANFKTLF